MNERIQELAEQSGATVLTTHGMEDVVDGCYVIGPARLEKFAQLIVAKVLDEVAERAYYSGDRAWSDELDRRWVELEFGMGELAELKNERS